MSDRYEPTPDEVHEIHRAAVQFPHVCDPDQWAAPDAKLRAQLLADWLEANPDPLRPFEHGDPVDLQGTYGWTHGGRTALGVTTQSGEVSYEWQGCAASRVAVEVRHHVEGTK